MTETWRVVRRWSYWTCLGVAVSACRPAVSREARVVPNDNRTPAGSLEGGVLTLATRPSAPDDTIQIPPGAMRERSFVAGAPGTYFYWASTTHAPVADRYDVDSQLHGAFIIDSAGIAPPPDRIFVLGS